MKRIFLSYFAISFLLVLFCSRPLYAQDLVYEPKNPAFGGSYLNYQWLLQSAQTQDTHKDPDQTDRFDRDPMADFQDNLNRQILNQLARNIVATQFGEQGLTEGEYLIGNYRIEVFSDEGGINVSINDTSTGNSTRVTVPYF